MTGERTMILDFGRLHLPAAVMLFGLLLAVFVLL